MSSSSFSSLEGLTNRDSPVTPQAFPSDLPPLSLLPTPPPPPPPTEPAGIVEARVAAYQDLVDVRSQKKYTVYIIAVRDNVDNEYHLEKVSHSCSFAAPKILPENVISNE